MVFENLSGAFLSFTEEFIVCPLSRGHDGGRGRPPSQGGDSGRGRSLSQVGGEDVRFSRQNRC